MKIQIEVKNVYGNKVVYPICETAKKFAELTQTKQLTHKALCIIEALGYEITTTSPTLEDIR
jgi:hypothetical protein